MLKNNIFIPYTFDLLKSKSINYYYISILYDIADYNEETKCFDTIKYNSLNDLALKAKINITTLRRLLNNIEYSYYFTHDNVNRTIKLKTGIPFIKLSRAELDIIYKCEELQNKLALKMYLYIKCACGISETGTADFTSEQLCNSIGYCANSGDTRNRIKHYRDILVDNGLITVEHYRQNSKNRIKYNATFVK